MIRSIERSAKKQVKKNQKQQIKEELRQDRLQKKSPKTVENPTETGSALRKTGEETAEMGNVETTVSGAVSKE